MKSTPASSVRNYMWMESILNCFFSLSANVLTTAVMNIFIKEKFLVRWMVFGVIGGGIIYGSVAQLGINIGAAIGSGSGASLLTVLYYYLIYPKLNRKRVIDSLGIIYVLIVSLCSSLIVSPYTLRVYYSNGVPLPALATSSSPGGEPVPNKELAGWTLTFPAITILIGGASGALVCLLLRCFNEMDFEEENIMSDKMFMLSSHGLRSQKEKKKKKQRNTVTPQLSQTRKRG